MTCYRKYRILRCSAAMVRTLESDACGRALGRAEEGGQGLGGAVLQADVLAYIAQKRGQTGEANPHRPPRPTSRHVCRLVRAEHRAGSSSATGPVKALRQGPAAQAQRAEITGRTR
jgi:hypothetical protein